MSISGPIVLDLKGLHLDAEEREILQHPLVSGIVLFARNYESPTQVAELCHAVRAAVARPFLIAVDQEGGRVQRFQQGFTKLPPMRQLGHFYETNPEQALVTATACGWLMAAELFSVGVNCSFAPVIDLDIENNAAIGNRAFHSDPAIVVKLAKALIQGMHTVGMVATGKHFPGHGSVAPDSHKTMPVDQRDYKAIQSLDMQTFAALIKENLLDAVMPAHILFPQVDGHPVGFSQHWLRTVLRKELNFQGVIVSDDLNMEGAAIAGDYISRAKAALDAGCDLALICNNRPAAIAILDHLPQEQYLLKNEKVKIMQKPPTTKSYSELRELAEWKEKHERVTSFVEHMNLMLSAN